MASAYLIFTQYNGTFPANDSPVDVKAAGLTGKLPFRLPTPRPDAVFQVTDYSLDIEQTLNIGSQSSGAGAGKVAFKPFSITRQIDSVSPQLLLDAASGASFKFVDLLIARRAESADLITTGFRFGLCAVKTMAWARDDESPTETITFEYGALAVEVNRPSTTGGQPEWTTISGWNRVKNVRWNGLDPVS